MTRNESESLIRIPDKIAVSLLDGGHIYYIIIIDAVSGMAGLHFRHDDLYHQEFFLFIKCA